MAFPSIPRLRILLPLLCVAAGVAATLPHPVPAHAQLGDAGLWNNVSRVSSLSFRGLEPDVAYDNDGFAHVVYYGGPSQDQWAIYYTNNRNGAFFAGRLISEASGEQRSPDIAIGSDNHIHVSYDKRKNADIMYVESPDLGTTWYKPDTLTESGAKAYESAIAVDANNTVHVVWCDRRWSSVQSITYAARPANGNWTAAGALASGSTFDRYPDITATGTKTSVRLHIVYQGRKPDSNFNSDFEIYYINSDGGRFQPARIISNDSNAWSLEPAITSDGNNEIYVAWDKQVDGSHDIVFARSIDLGQNWTEPRNITRRPNTAVTPYVAFGKSGGIPRVHIAWDEGGYALYLLYEASSNSFGDSIEQVSTQRQATDIGVAASNVSDEVSVAYQAYEGATLQAYIASKGAGTLVTATPSINDGAQYTTSRDVTIKLSNVRGAPTEMRYSWTLGLNDSTKWVPFQQSFNLTIPYHPFCEQRLYIQFRAADGRASQVFNRSIILDNDIQAAVTMRNPYFGGNDSSFLPLAAVQDLATSLASNGDAAYTRRDFFYTQIANIGECSSLTRFYLGNSKNPFPLDNNGFINVLPLPGSSSDGPREVPILIEDSLGNKKTFTQTITLDREPPTVTSGSVSVAAPKEGLSTVLANLTFSNVNVQDDYYPGGRWGVWIANTANATVQDNDASLQWQPVSITQEGSSFVVNDWNVLNGISTKISDRSLAGKTIQVRVKFLDGAGNASVQTLNTTVTLASNFTPDTSFLPLNLR